MLLSRRFVHAQPVRTIASPSPGWSPSSKVFGCEHAARIRATGDSSVPRFIGCTVTLCQPSIPSSEVVYQSPGRPRKAKPPGLRVADSEVVFARSNSAEIEGYSPCREIANNAFPFDEARPTWVRRSDGMRTARRICPSGSSVDSERGAQGWRPLAVPASKHWVWAQRFCVSAHGRLNGISDRR